MVPLNYVEHSNPSHKRVTNGVTLNSATCYGLGQEAFLWYGMVQWFLPPPKMNISKRNFPSLPPKIIQMIIAAIVRSNVTLVEM